MLNEDLTLGRDNIINDESVKLMNKNRIGVIVCLREDIDVFCVFKNV
jgi:hypothetical protein